MKNMKNVSILTMMTCAFLAVQVATAAADFFVSLDGTHQPPFSEWGTAATNIQDAVDLADVGATVWVSNGVYHSGSQTNYPSGTILKNRLVIDKAVTVRSLDPDPALTIIQGSRDPDTGSTGSNAVRCVYMDKGAMLTGFTITNGATLIAPPKDDSIGAYNNPRPGHNYNGGGIFVNDSGTVSNCVIAGNLAGAFGAGTHGGTVVDCEIVGNTARMDSWGGEYGGGGGACLSTLRSCRLTKNEGHYGSAMYSGTAYNSYFTDNASTYTCYKGNLYNCLIVSNTSTYGVRSVKMYNCTVANNNNGVQQEVTLVNCIVYFNRTSNFKADYKNYTTYTCTWPTQDSWVSGDGNITNNPSFINSAAGDFRLPYNSPCVDAGTNGSWTVNGVDMDNQRRVDKVLGIVDMGCYEYAYPRGTIYIIK